MSFSVVDWVLLIVLLLGGFRAGANGFFHEISYKLGYLLGFFAALMWSQDLAIYIQSASSFSLLISLIIAYIIIFLLAFILVALLGHTLTNLFDRLKLSFVDKLLGFVIGIFEALVIIVILYSLLRTQEFFDLSPWLDKSWICTNILNDFITYSIEAINGANIA